MSDQNKENLRKLLNFLNNEIIHKPENAWFVDELRKVLSAQSSNQPTTDSSAVSKIEHYLAIDYKLDSIKTVIDYSFIKDDYIRDCFEADFREMLRYKFGSRGHCQNFYEFSRYAMMQIERMLNLYYFCKGDTIEKRVEYIRHYNEQYKLPTDKKGNPIIPKSIESIAFNIKIWAYKYEFNLDEDIFNGIDRIAKVRNIQSHGSSQPNADEIFFQTHYAKLSNDGYPLLANGLVDWGELKKNTVKWNIYDSTIRKHSDHKRYIELEWQRRRPFDEVFSTLRLTVEASLLINVERKKKKAKFHNLAFQIKPLS